MFSTRIGDRHQAACNGVIHYFVVSQFADENGAGTAITFPATDLGAFQMAVITDKVEHNHPGRKVCFNRFVIEDKCYQ